MRPQPGPILVIESDPVAAGTLMEQLRADGYQAELARTAEHARALARRQMPRLLLLGGLDRDRDGLDLLTEIRRADRARAIWAPELPVIFLGAGARGIDTLRAFEAGADDFMSRPAPYLELRARVRAVLRRMDPPSPRTCLAVDRLEVDVGRRTATLDGHTIELRRLEFELLAHLAGDPERVFSRHELLRSVWGYRSHGSTRTLDSHASRLRRKLEDRGGEGWVVNVWGVGYRLR